MLGPEDISVEEHSALMNVAPGQHETQGEMNSRTVMMGRSTSVSPNTSTTVFYSTVSDEGTDWELHLQVTNLPPIRGGPGLDGGQVFGTVTYTLGEATFFKSFLIQTDAPYRFKAIGRRVQLDIFWVGSGPIPLDVVAGGCRAGFGSSPLDYYVPTWLVNTNSLAGESSNSIDVPGDWTPFISTTLYSILISWQAMLLSMPTTGQAGANACCLMFFDLDNISKLITGIAPIWRSPPFTSANQWYSFDDGDCPQVRYVNGLVWALSSTFDTYTAVGTGSAAIVDVKLGS